MAIYTVKTQLLHNGEIFGAGAKVSDFSKEQIARLTDLDAIGADDVAPEPAQPVLNPAAPNPAAGASDPEPAASKAAANAAAPAPGAQKPAKVSV